MWPSDTAGNDRAGAYGHGFGVNVPPSGGVLTVEYHNGFVNRPYPFEPNQWYHIAAKFGRGHLRVLVDGDRVVNRRYDEPSLEWLTKNTDRPP